MVEASRCSPQQKAVEDTQYTNPYECVLAIGKTLFIPVKAIITDLLVSCSPALKLMYYLNSRARCKVIVSRLHIIHISLYHLCYHAYVHRNQRWLCGLTL